MRVQVKNQICSRHDIAEILLRLALNINQTINTYTLIPIFIRKGKMGTHLLYSFGSDILTLYIYIHGSLT